MVEQKTKTTGHNIGAPTGSEKNCAKLTYQPHPIKEICDNQFWLQCMGKEIRKQNLI